MVERDSLSPAYVHVLPETDFDEISRGGGSAEAMERLWACEYSRRLILLRTLLDLASAQPALLGPLPPAEAAWLALEELDSEPQTAAVLREVLLHPQVGVWMSHTLRAIRTGRGGPLWPEVGRVHSLAFAVAVRSGRRAEAQLPARHGRVLLPTLGLARMPYARESSVVSANTASGTTSMLSIGVAVDLPSDLTVDTKDWWSLRRLRACAGNNVLELTIDDIDPFRDLADPIPPRRLSDRSLHQWSELLDEAWQILNKGMPSTAVAMGAGLRSLAPLPGEANGVTRSASTGDGFGAVLSTRPHDAVDMAVTLIHEFQHTKLGGLLHLDDLFDDDGTARFYAPWRDDPRPLGGLFQGVYAFLGICGFWRRLHELTSDLINQFEFAYVRRQTWTGLRALMGSGMTNELGDRFVRGMVSRLQPWMAEPVPPMVASGSWYAAKDHEIAWRARNLKPDPLQVNDLAESWIVEHGPSARSASPPPVPQVDTWARRRLVMLRLQAGSPARFAKLQASAPDDADMNLVAGNVGQAVRSYRMRLRQNVEDNDAWSGLALAAIKQADSSPWRTLLRRPELVKAVCREVHGRLREADPLSVASWCERFTEAWGPRRSQP